MGGFVDKRKNFMFKIGVIMLIVVSLFCAYALNHPQASFL
jgi:hypothetical protein